ncbi:MAG: peptide chain release factor N(5)-glutamine methyltransferase [Deltaproteobacteria bacterium]
MNIGESIRWAEESLRVAAVTEARSEAEYLLMHVIGCKRHTLFIEASKTLSEDQEGVFKRLIERRAKREPSQYITGEAEFYGFTFKVTKDTLIPRPETELLVDEALRCALHLAEKKPLTIIDLCTGSGCIAVTMALKLPGSVVYATDISKAALKVAAENAELNNVADRVIFLEGDLFTALDGTPARLADIILSNPPYISESEIEILEPEVIVHEPKSALYGGPDGLAFYRRIITEAPERLSEGGFILLEMGFGQSEDIRGLMEKEHRYKDIAILKDYSGIERVIKGRAGKNR